MNNSVRVLLIEDEEKMRELIKIVFRKEDFVIIEAVDGKQGLNLFRTNSVDIVILDIMLPEIDGWTVCREIRRTSNIPIILLTARGEEFDKLFGFELGADDYLVKPFSPKELMARVKALLRRAEIKSNEAVSYYRFGDIVIDRLSREVTVNGRPVNLTNKEYELLYFLAANPKIVFTREQLLLKVWGYEQYGDPRTVDTHIKKLREKLGDYSSCISTMWGVGYKFEVPK
ncbi:MAG TPA: response regulator transcription factor [Bacillota bacterium]|nr:response regulator transcription factor [Clostridiaceae bacterium]HNR05001.1 response regulator transcription factor [Bacillota bacterium]HNT03542.1 response regulator transcription factor [Bacillota bacterium]HNU80166.1 response regulator transcription factor [Bacillota bacterium]HPA55448.1 response regulator transcription factor [Bacillota bacterium]